MRVIAGEFGGRRLDAPRGLGTRPTSDRVREAWLMSLEPFTDRVVVDLYAGSGALGIETLSRGARAAHFVEHDAGALRALRHNLDTLGIAARATVWPLRLPQGLARLESVLATADLVLADPPYGGDEARAILAALGAPGRLAAGTRVGIEHHRRDTLPETIGTLARARERRHGETVVSLYRRVDDSPPPPREDP